MGFRARINRAYDLAIIAPAALGKLLPYRWRWNALRLIAGVLVPVAWAIGRYRDGYGAVGLVTQRENVFYNVLARATQLGIGFAPRLAHRCLDELDHALDEQRPVMIVGVHAPLLYLAGRYLVERGCDTAAAYVQSDIAIIGKPGHTYPGIVFNDARAMLRLSRALVPGRVVTALIDNAPGRRIAEVAIGPIRVHLAYPLLKLAIDRGAALLFFHPHLDRGAVRIRWHRCEAADTDAAVAALVTFLTEESRAL